MRQKQCEILSKNALFTANLPNILYGYASGWTSASLLVLNSKDSPLAKGPLDQEERSWVTSLFAISGVIGTIIYYVLADFVGRKIPLWSVAIPHLVSWPFLDLEVGSRAPHSSDFPANVSHTAGSGGGFLLCLVIRK